MKYNPASKSSIMAHALTILGKSLRDLYPEAVAGTGRGSFGNSMELYHFGYANNNNPAPDFEEIGYDLKCTPLDPTDDGFEAGERLVLTMIDFVEEAKAKQYTESHFWEKAKLLLIFYLREKGGPYLDYIVEMIRWWEIPEEDLKIIIDDWNKIHNKLVNGLAHELSEGDTMYLGACTKSSDSTVRRPQYKANAPQAKPRAYCLKKQYMNWLAVDSYLDRNNTHVNPAIHSLSQIYIEKILKKKQESGGVIKSIADYKQGETFENLIERKFSPYYGMTLSEIATRTGILISSSSKDYAFQVCKAILGIQSRRIEEFEKAGILLKSVCLENDLSSLKESMSFPAFKYLEIVEEEQWEDSQWYDIVSQRFFFVVFRKSIDRDRNKLRLHKVFFWAMPNSDLDHCEKLWRDTRDKTKLGLYDSYMKSSENPVCHIRPHAQNAADTYPTPSGYEATKKCFWLNRKYVLKVVKHHIDNVELEIPYRIVADTTNINLK